MSENITITIDDRAIMDALKRLQTKMINLKPVMQIVAGMMESAIQRNFADGGRPAKWAPLKYRKGQPLIDTGRLKNSITSDSDATSAIAGVSGNIEYAAIQNFGGKTKATIIRPRNKKALFWPGARHPVMMVKHPGSVIPARPFMVIPDEDMGYILDTLGGYLKN
jgi:phage virion morphogenesis protein